MWKVKDNVNLKELEKFGYIELQNCYYKDPQPALQSSNWVLRVDKTTRQVKYWNFSTGKMGPTRKYVEDLIKAGIVEDE